VTRTHRTHRTTRATRPARLVALPALALAAALSLGACSSGGSTPGTSTPGTSTPGTSAADASGTSATASALTLTDPWVKAADSGMTAAFGTLTNTSSADIRIVTATSPAATALELHEIATDASGAMVMRPKDGGFVVPAHGTHVLSPGGDHLMFMGVTAPIKAGDEVTIELTAADGSVAEVTAQARTFDGGNETYQGAGDGTADMAGMSPSPTPSAP